MAYRDSTTNSGNSATPSVTVPAGAASGDIAIVAINMDNAANAVDPADLPAGFVELSEGDNTTDGQTSWVGWKRLSGADAGSYTFGSLGAVADWVCQCILFSGRHATDPPVVSAIATNNTNNITGTAVTANGVTALDGDDLVWVCSPDVTNASAGNGATPPASYVEAEDAELTWANLAMAYRENVSAGATGTVSGSFAVTATGFGYTAWLVRIPVAAAGGGTSILRQMMQHHR